ncbi:MAG: hypothetical protein G01um101433_1007 [Parcubacteria group bacterium Gr01-1014_33]|nr:MAG: hypothetical protein G01um101433_1007 [Parcubacteria group bacterium Gr01-1014_33]
MRIKEHQQAIGLRLQGKTYGEIRNALGVPKSTQSNWFKTLTLSQEAKSALARKQGRGLIALGLCNEKRTRTIHEENELIRSVYEATIGALSKRDLTLIGAALYWAEGYKNFNTARRSYPL